MKQENLLFQPLTFIVSCYKDQFTYIVGITSHLKNLEPKLILLYYAIPNWKLHFYKVKTPQIMLLPKLIHSVTCFFPLICRNLYTQYLTIVLFHLFFKYAKFLPALLLSCICSLYKINFSTPFPFICVVPEWSSVFSLIVIIA